MTKAQKLAARAAAVNKSIEALIHSSMVPGFARGMVEQHLTPAVRKQIADQFLADQESAVPDKDDTP